MKNKLFVYFLFFFTLVFLLFAYNNLSVDKKIEDEVAVNEISDVLGPEILVANFPEKISHNTKNLDIRFTIKNSLQEFSKQLLKRYQSEIASIVVIENRTGNILAAVDYSKAEDKFGTFFTFSREHPAASVFKIVTAASLFEYSKVTPDTTFEFWGRPTTLYKHQLMDSNRRWSKEQKFEEAFATSNNVIFGKAAIKNINSTSLFEMASKMGFNNKLIPLVPMEQSVFSLAQSQYELAEFASGLNDVTRMSPVHAAMLASIVANKGKLITPNLVHSISLGDKIFYQAETKENIIISQTTASYLEKMMVSTVLDGTAKKSFKYFNRNPANKGIIVGGKTGSMTGGNPLGKRDWFVAFAKDPSLTDPGISVCVMIINTKKWYVRSSYIAKELIEYYYNPYVDQLIGADFEKGKKK